MPEIPNYHAAATLLLTIFALFLFSSKKVSLESSCLAVLVILTVGFEIFPLQLETGPLSPTAFYLGFGHEALIAVCGLMIVGQGLIRTGALIPIARIIGRIWKISPTFSMLVTLIFAAFFSAFVNNAPIVVLLIPILVSVAHGNHQSPKPWLMPMNFSTLLGGTCTTIGTSTNLLVVGVAADLGLRKFGMFDFAVPGLIAGSIGLLYLWLVAPFLCREKDSELQMDQQRLFIFQLQFPEDSPSIGATISKLIKKMGKSTQIIMLRKASNGYSGTGTRPLPDTVIEAGDRMTIRGTADVVKDLESQFGATVCGDELLDEDEKLQLAEFVPLENSRLVTRTLSEVRFANTYQIIVVAIHRAGRAITTMPEGIDNIRLQAGDVLLVQGTPEKIDALKSDVTLLLLDSRIDVPISSRARAAILILAAVVTFAAAGIMPIATSAVFGVLAMLMTRCINWRDIQMALSVPVIMIVVVSLALGSALTKTGATVYIAELFIFGTAGAAPATILASLILLMAIFTNIISNNAAAVIGTPIAISIANQLGVPPEPFVLAVLFGANLSFATPMAYKTNVLIMGAGGYSFMDFVRVGLPLTLILWASYSYILPRIYGI